MTAATAHGARAEINMTPMIDVLLVLLIIFMVITPLAPPGLDTLLPQPATAAASAPRSALVLSVDAGGAVLLNHEAVQLAQLPARLAALAALGRDTVFVRGAKALEFHEVARVIDIARGAGMHRVALMTE